MNKSAQKHLFNQAAAASLPRSTACFSVCGHIELQSVRVVGDGAVEFAQGVVADRRGVNGAAKEQEYN